MPMKQYKTTIPQRRTVRIKGRLFDFITCFPIKVEMVGAQAQLTVHGWFWKYDDVPL